MTAKERGKGKAGKKVVITKSPIRIPVKSIWDEVVEKEELAEKKKTARNLTFI